MAVKTPEVGMRVRFRDPQSMSVVDPTCNRAHLACLVRNWGDHVFTIAKVRSPYEGATLAQLTLEGKTLTAVWERELGRKPSWFRLEAPEFYLERYFVLVS